MIFLISESVSVTREQKKRTEGVLTNLSVIKTVIYFVSNFLRYRQGKREGYQLSLLQEMVS